NEAKGADADAGWFGLKRQNLNDRAPAPGPRYRFRTAPEDGAAEPAEGRQSVADDTSAPSDKKYAARKRRGYKARKPVSSPGP
ncbi:MAG: hypothetical protein AAGJ87_11770, partial [Pseudomonadota bacterium]